MRITSLIVLTLCMSSVGLSAGSCNLVDTVRDRKIDSKDAVVTKISKENVESPEECYRTCCDLSESDSCITAEYTEKENVISCKLYKCESDDCPTKRAPGKVIYYIGKEYQNETTTEKTLTTPTQDTVSTDSTLTDTSKTPTTQLSASTESASHASSSSVTGASITSESTTQSTSTVITTENGQMNDNTTEEQNTVSSTMNTFITTQSSFTTSTLDGPGGNETDTGHEPEEGGPSFVLIAAIVVGVVVALVICVLVGKWLYGYFQRRNYTEMDK